MYYFGQKTLIFAEIYEIKRVLVLKGIFSETAYGSVYAYVPIFMFLA